MLELFSSGLMTQWLNTLGLPQPTSVLNSVIGQEVPWMAISGQPDSFVQMTLQQYLKQLSAKGLATSVQGVWLQSGPLVLASNQGTTPLPAASLTKVATSLVTLHTWRPEHQFETLVSATGPIQKGVLQGDLVIQGNGDPLFVWEEAIAVGNALNQMGISKITGNLIITGNFSMNFEENPIKSGQLLKQALNSSQWSAEIEEQYQALSGRVPRPKVAIAGSVQAVTYGTALLPKQVLLLKRRSLPLSQILRLMNIYSNNVVAESLANSLGGAQVVAQQSALIAGFPQEEILLINGSGLGEQNRISPRAVCAMLAAIQRYGQSYGLAIADLFPTSGIDYGTIAERRIPTAAVVKTGTLDDVSALAGVVPTRDRGLIWFTIINRGTDLDSLRDQQDILLQKLVSHWGSASPLPVAVVPQPSSREIPTALGANDRNEILTQPAVEVSHSQ